MNTPLERNLQALDDDGNVIWEADLEEHAEAADPEAHRYSNAVPAFHGLSKGADVSGKVSAISELVGVVFWDCYL